MTTADDGQLSDCIGKEGPKHFLKIPNLHQKGSRSLFGGLLPVWLQCSFLNPGKTIISEDLCSVNRWRLHWHQHAAGTGQREGPDSTWHRPYQLMLQSWGTKACLTCHIHDLYQLTPYKHLDSFCRRVFITSRMKMLFKSSLSPEAWIYATGIAFILIGKIWWLTSSDFD